MGPECIALQSKECESIMNCDENAPSAGTERIDCIEKCYSSLSNSIVVSSKTSCNARFTLADPMPRLGSDVVGGNSGYGVFFLR